MKLLTQQMKERISRDYPLYSQDGKGKEAICVAKFFIGNWTWYILEGNIQDDDFIMYGIVINDIDNEYGYVSLKEMESIIVHGFEIERDRYFEKKPLKDIDDEQLNTLLSSIYSEAEVETVNK